MQDIKNIYLVAWKNRNFFDKNDNPIGSIQLPEIEEEFSAVWHDMKFGEHSNFEEAQRKLGQFSGGIIKDSNPYQHTLSKGIDSFFQEEFELLIELKKVVGTDFSRPSGEIIETDSDLDGYRFYVIESKNKDSGVTVYHFARFIPKYHILMNKRMLRTKQEINSVHNDSHFLFKSIILIEPTAFASAIYNKDQLDNDISNVQIFVHNPETYEKAFILRNSYFKYAQSKFKQFKDSDRDTRRTISLNNIEVDWDENLFNPADFFNQKNVNIAKKFAKDTDDDKQYDIIRIVEANNKLINGSDTKPFNRPLEFLYNDKGEVISLKVTEESVGTLAAIMDGQIWTNEIHQKTQTNI